MTGYTDPSIQGSFIRPFMGALKGDLSYLSNSYISQPVYYYINVLILPGINRCLGSLFANV